MPANGVTTTNPSAPVDRLSLNVHDLRARADVTESGANAYPGICFDAGDE